jgi:radical SAM protein with 4Fe4S-binding SPASM domain
MRTIAAIQVDLEVTPLGTRSRLADELCGQPVLRRTVQQACRIEGLSGVHVLAPEAHVARCRELIRGLDAEVLGIQCAPPVWAKIVQSSRKWSLNGWRGGIGGCTVFDEFTDCRALSGLLECIPADAVLSIPAGAVMLNPELADQMIERRNLQNSEARLTFTQAIPGVAGIVLDAALVREMARSGIPLSWLMTYKPDEPRKDLIFQAACLDIAAPLRFARGRLIADTDHAVRTMNDMLRKQETWSVAEIGEYLVRHDEEGAEDFPLEVEVELTTDDPYPESLLAPRGRRVGRNGVMELSLMRRIADELRHRDDTLCVLGGFGEPLRHPGFREVLELLRPRQSGATGGGVFGLCVRTSGADITPEIVEALIEHDVDVLSVALDAWTDATYGMIKGVSDGGTRLAQVRERLDALATRQRECRTPVPIMVPDMIKARENVAELDEFFDGWTRRAGAVSITGVSDYAGQLDHRAVIDMRPPQRVACRRVRSRCLILCDGRVALCDQDFKGLHTVGNVGESTLVDIWTSERFERVRAMHRDQHFSKDSLCASCSEWHRP